MNDETFEQVFKSFAAQRIQAPMIAVVADDLTGAAEIAGIGWRHGLSAVILSRNEPPVEADLVVCDSDSRLCTAAEAARRVTRILNRFQRLRPEWIFKKVDSVLRGNVLPEVEAMMKLLARDRCLLVPANPRAGRTIRGGSYFVQGKPIDHTDFRKDPHHPRHSSRVKELLRPAGRLQLAVRTSTARSLPEGVIVGQATGSQDVQRWAARVDEATLAAGGGEFFTALLRRHKPAPTSKPVAADVRRLTSFRSVARTFRGSEPTHVGCHKEGFASRPGGRTLFICGSLAEQAHWFMRSREADGWPVLRMPVKLASSTRANSSLMSAWAEQIANELKRNRSVIMTIDRPELVSRSAAQRLGRVFIDVAARVLTQTRPDCVCVEGGATAAALTQRMKWTRFKVVREFAAGVTAVRPHACPDTELVLKPGSYEWPAAVIAGNL